MSGVVCRVRAEPTSKLPTHSHSAPHHLQSVPDDVYVQSQYSLRGREGTCVLLGPHVVVHFVFGIEIGPTRMECEAILAAFAIEIWYSGAEPIVIFRGLAAIFWGHFEIAGIDVTSKGYERLSIWIMVVVESNAVFV